MVMRQGLGAVAGHNTLGLINVLAIGGNKCWKVSACSIACMPGIRRTERKGLLLHNMRRMG